MNAVLTLSGFFYMLICLFASILAFNNMTTRVLIGDKFETISNPNMLYLAIGILLHGILMFFIALAVANILGRMQKADKEKTESSVS